MMMTEVSDVHSVRVGLDLKVLPTPEGRKLYFSKECFEPVTIFRKVNDEDWEVVAWKARTPYLDEDRMIPPTLLRYKVLFGKSHQESNIAAVHIPDA